MIAESTALDRFTVAYLQELDDRTLAYHGLKVAIGRVLAACLLLVALPMIAVLVVVVRLTSRGPAIYRQTRVGQHGREFDIFKIRTMVIDAEAKSGPVWSSSGVDPRITRLGRILRQLHLDELPQLYNVIRGEMVLIGPRPERPAIVRVLAAQIPDYVSRMAVPPGVTGLAQINLPADTDLASVRRKLMLDLKYIRSAGPFLDLRILLATVVRVAGVPRSWGTRVLGLRELAAILVAPSDSLALDFSGRQAGFETRLRQFAGRGESPSLVPEVSIAQH